MHLETHLIDCPYCGESIELTLEPQDAEQVYFEDCHVCCRPILVNAFISNGKAIIQVTQEDLGF